MKKTLFKGLLIFAGIMVAIGAFSEAIDKLSNKPSMTTNKSNQTPTSVVTLTPEEKLRKNINDELLLGGEIKDIKITKGESNTFSVKVTLNANENLTKELTKVGIKKDVGDTYYSIYKEDLGVQYAVVSVWYPTINKYGNKSEAIIYQARLTKDEVSKINWSLDKTLIKGKVIPELWEVEQDNLDRL